MKSYLVFFAGVGPARNGRLGSVERTDANIREAHRLMYLSLIQEDITGTLNYSVLGVRRVRR